MKRQFLTPGGEIIEVDVAQSRQYAAPVAYFSLTPEEVSALETERDELVASLPRLLKADRIKATGRINDIEATLRRARSNTEADRTNREREQERLRESTGNPNVGSNPTSGNSHFAAMRAAANAGVCCVGPYKCAKCKAKAKV